MKTTISSTTLRVFACLLGAGCVLYGTLALVQCLFPTWGMDGEQPVLTQAETAVHAAVSLLYGGVLLVPPGLLTSRLAYWFVCALRVAALGFVMFLFGGLPWSELERFAVLLDVCLALFLFTGVTASLWELGQTRTAATMTHQSTAGGNRVAAEFNY